MAKALGQCTFWPGSSMKRFAKSMRHMAELMPERVLSGKQDQYLRQMVHKFRRQIPDHVVALAGKVEA